MLRADVCFQGRLGAETLPACAFAGPRFQVAGMTEVGGAAYEGSQLGMHGAGVDVEVAFLCEGFTATGNYTREGTPFVECCAGVVDFDMPL